MADDLKIQITGTLNQTSTVSEINGVLGKIQSDPKLKTLSINIGITDAQINNVVKQIASIQDKLKGTTKPIPFIDPEQEEKMKASLTTFDQVVAKYKELGSIKISQDQINPLTNQLEKFSLTVTKGTGEVEKLKFELASLNGLVIEGKANELFVPTKVSSIDNTQAVYEKQLQQIQAINSKIDQQDAKEKEVTQQLENQITLYQRQAEIQASALLNNPNKILSTDQQASLQNYLISVRALNTETPQVQQRMRELGLDFREINTQAATASTEAVTFGSALKSAFAPLSMYFGGFALFMQAVNSLKQGISSLNDMNKSLTTISMISHQSQADVAQLAVGYQKLGEQLGVSVTDMASMAAELTRQQLPLDEVNNRLKTITEFSKVAGLSATDAVTYITAATNSMRISAQAASDTFAALGHSSAVNAG